MAQKICRSCLILWGGPGHHAPGYFLTTRRDPRGQKMKPKEKATPSSLRKWRGACKERVPTIAKSDRLFPKLEYCLEGEAADYFQNWPTNFFGPEPRSALLFLTTDNSTPFGTMSYYMSRGVGWQLALWARPLYRGPVAKRVAVSAGGASLGSVQKILPGVE